MHKGKFDCSLTVQHTLSLRYTCTSAKATIDQDTQKGILRLTACEINATVTSSSELFVWQVVEYMGHSQGRE